MSDDPITDNTPCASRPMSVVVAHRIYYRDGIAFDPVTAEDMQADGSLPRAGLTPEQQDAILAALGQIVHASPGASKTSITVLGLRLNHDWAEEKTLADFRRVFADERKWKSLGFGRTEG